MDDATSLRRATAIGRHVYRIRYSNGSAVLKLFGHGSERAAQRELLGGTELKHLIPEWSPRLLEVGKSPSGACYLLYEEIDGITLGRAISLSHVSPDQALQVLAQILLRVHRRQREGFGPLHNPQWTTAPEFLRDLAMERIGLLVLHGRPDLAGHLDELGQRLMEQAPQSSTATICHNDLHYENVLVRKQEGRCTIAGVIDPESMIFAFPEFDIAKSLVVSSCPDEQSLSELVAAYGSAALNHQLIRDLVTYHAIDGWLWARLIEGRDLQIWDTRLEAALGCHRCASRTRDARPGRSTDLWRRSDAPGARMSERESSWQHAVSTLTTRASLAGSPPGPRNSTNSRRIGPWMWGMWE